MTQERETLQFQSLYMTRARRRWVNSHRNMKVSEHRDEVAIVWSPTPQFDLVLPFYVEYFKSGSPRLNPAAVRTNLKSEGPFPHLGSKAGVYCWHIQ